MRLRHFRFRLTRNGVPLLFRFDEESMRNASSDSDAIEDFIRTFSSIFSVLFLFFLPDSAALFCLLPPAVEAAVVEAAVACFWQ